MEKDDGFEEQMLKDMKRGNCIKGTFGLWTCGGIPRNAKQAHECGVVYIKTDTKRGIAGKLAWWYGFEELGVAIKRLLVEQGVETKPKTKGDNAVFGLKRCGKYGKCRQCNR